MAKPATADETEAPAAASLDDALAALAGADFAAAIGLASAVIEADPNDAAAWDVLGLARFRAGDAPGAALAARQAADLPPATVGRLTNLGVYLRGAGRDDEAEAAYRAAIEVSPDFAAAHHNLGNLLMDAGRLAEAGDSLRQALNLDPEHAEAWRSLGMTLQRAGWMEDAVTAFRRLLEVSPGHARGLNDLGGCLMALERQDQALAAFEEAIERHPNFPDAHGNLGALHLRGGRPVAARAASERTLELAPSEHRWMGNLAVALKDLGYFDEAETLFRRALAVRPDYAIGHGNLLFCLNYHPDRSAEAVFAEYQAWERAHAAPKRPAEPIFFANDRDPNRRLRVGLVSPDFREHSARHFIEPLMAGFDRMTFEIVCYAEVALPDATTARFQGMADEWRSTVGLSDTALAEAIRADRIDVLIDLGGHTAASRLMVFAHKPAPVQIAHLLGHGYTSGLSAMDAFLADAELAPEGSDHLFAETVIRLPRIPLVYAPPEGMPKPGPTPALAKGHVTFGYFGRPERINDKVIAAWSRILGEVPGSRLMLNAKAFSEPAFKALMQQRFEAQGIGAERLGLVYTSPQPTTWAAYGDVDIALDPWPHNAGTTTIEALWLGVPVLTIKDRPSVGRFGASILSAVGLTDWIAEDTDAYVARAVQAASDIPTLQALRESLRARFLASPLADAPDLGKHTADAIRGLWSNWCEAGADVAAAEAQDWSNKSDAFRLQGRLPESEAAARRALALRPGFAVGYLCLGNALAAMSRLDEADAAFASAIDLKPDYAEVFNNRGLSRMRRGLVGPAEQDLRRAFELRPDMPEIGFNLAATLQDQGKLEEALACYRAAVEARPQISAGHGAMLFCLNYQPQLTPDEVFAEFQAWDARHARPHTPVNPRWDNDPDPNRRLRIGYVSPDFGAKSARHFIEPMLAGHDRRAVEVFAYAEVPNPDAVTAHLRKLTDHWRPTVGLSDDEMAAMIREDRIDVIVDLGGHTARNRLLALARKPAPVQIAHFLGHGYTSGLTAMDAFLADEQLAPIGSEAVFSERVVRLDRIPIAYQPPGDLPAVTPTPALAKGFVTFGHFGRTVRINDLVVAAWARILNAVPGSRLMLNTGPFADPGVCERYREKFRAHGVEADRLDLVFTTPQPRTWAAYGEVDIALDPFPHNAGTTTIEALWLGVPVLSLADRPSVGRFGLSILHAAGLDDWVADDVDAYVAKAVAAASDIPALAALRGGLRERMDASPLGDGAGLARALEQSYRGLWRAWCEKQADDEAEQVTQAAEAYGRRDFAAAAGVFEQLARRSVNAGHWSNLGACLRALGQTEAAENAYRQAIGIDPNLTNAHANLGNLLTGRGRFAEGAEAYERALEIAPNAADTWRALAVCRLAGGDPAGAHIAIDRALELAPDHAMARETLGSLLRGDGWPTAAVREYARAVKGAPEDPRILCNMAVAVQDLGRFDEAETLFRRALAVRPDHATGHGNLLFCLNYHPDRSAEAVFAEYQAWDRAHAAPKRPAELTFANDRAPNRRLRLGLVSPDFREHSARHFIEPLIAGFNRMNFEIVCYAEVALPDATTARFQGMADEWRSTVGLSDTALAEAIRADRIDVLIDLGGHTAASRLMVFAHKPAPVQIAHLLGHGYTSGLSAMDAFLADAELAPEGSDHLFAETVIRLPRIPLVYAPPEGMPKPGPTPALAKGHVTFGYFGRPERINDKVIAAWSRILDEVADSRLMLNAKAFAEPAFKALMEQRFAHHGVGPEQLQLVYTRPQPRTWDAYGEVDIALDPWPHNAGTTTIGALWLGVPVLTIKDRPSVGRFGASILSAVGLTDWIAEDADAYVTMAVRAAGDIPALQALRESLRPRFLASPLADAEDLGKHTAVAIRKLWTDWCTPAIDADAFLRQAIAAFGGNATEQAIDLASQVLAIAPDHGDALHVRGLAAFRLGRLEQARADVARAAEVMPTRPEPGWNLIAILRALGELAAAEAQGRTSIAVSPEASEPHNNLGAVFQDMGNAADAQSCFRRAIELRPDHPSAWSNLAWSLNMLGRAGEAETAARRALSLNPGDANTLNNLGTALMHQDRLEEAADAFRAAVQLSPGFTMAHSNLLFCLNYHPDLSAEAIFDEYRRWNALHAAPLAPAAPPAFEFGDADRRLRVGYVSPDFRHHAVSFFIEPMLAAHDPAAVEVFCYAEVLQPDAVTARFQARADHWRSTVGMGDAALTDLIRADRIDVLVDLAGHTANNRLLSFARRAAPVQIAHMVGSGCTTGLTQMDGFLADAALAPPGAEALFSESLIRLPRIPLVYSPPPGMPQPAPLPALANGYVTFGSFTRTARINDGVLDVWSAILRAVPDARLMLNSKPFQEEATRKTFLARFAARGIAAERLDLVYTSPQPNTWAAYGDIDIALDPFPHNAGTTTIEALWLGVPVISLAARPPVGRFGKSILGAVGLDDWAVEDAEAYVAMAVAAAADLPALAQLRASLRARFEASPLGDAEGLTREIEAAYRALWRKAASAQG